MKWKFCVPLLAGLLACALLFVLFTNGAVEGGDPSLSKFDPVKKTFTRKATVPKGNESIKHPADIPAPFKLRSDFSPESKRWRPFTNNLELKPDVADGLELNLTEFTALQQTLSNLMAAAGALQAKNFHVSKHKNGNPIVFVASSLEGWSGIKETFEAELTSSIGKPKAEYFLESSKDSLSLITGNYGKMARVFEIVDLKPIIKDLPYNPRFTDWKARIFGGELAKLQYSEYFPADLQSQFTSVTGSVFSSLEGEKYFNEPPPFLSPMVEMQK